MMDLGEARALVANHKAKYAAFSRLEEAIAAVDQALGLMKEREGALAALQVRIDERTAELSELTNKVNLVKDALANSESSYAKRSHEMEEMYSNRRQEIANGIKNAEKEAEITKSGYRDEIVLLDRDKNHLQEQCTNLKQQIASIRQSLNISGT